MNYIENCVCTINYKLIFYMHGASTSVKRFLVKWILIKRILCVHSNLKHQQKERESYFKIHQKYRSLNRFFFLFYLVFCSKQILFFFLFIKSCMKVVGFYIFLNAFFILNRGFVWKNVLIVVWGKLKSIYQHQQCNTLQLLNDCCLQLTETYKNVNCF